jgi:proteasome lid subunit RPN8/RPN11
MWQEIVEHARHESPRECCGLIAGRANHPTRLFRLTNVAPGTTLYEIDPSEIFDLEFRQLPAAGLEVLSIYHSHPATEAYPSRTDQSQAFWADAVYLICSLADPETPVIRGFRLGGELVREVVIRFVD